MNLATIDIFHVLISIALILTVAHIGAFVANRVGLPPMVGELTGGILLGATVFQRLFPELQSWLFPIANPAISAILSFCSNIGLLILLFMGGRQLRKLITYRDTRAVFWISSLGLFVPVAAGLVILSIWDFSKYMGSANHLTALKIVLLIELGITSIPVITRIFIDLGLMETRLARIVLSVAVIEDVLLYIALSIALSLVHSGMKGDASIPHFLGFAPDSSEFIAWHVFSSVMLLMVSAWGFGDTRKRSLKYNLVAGRSPMGWTLISILTITVIAMFFGLAPMFGALVAGIIASTNTDEKLVKAQQQIEVVGGSFFIPIYFALIGMSLDLIRDLDIVFTIGLLLVGTIVKYGGSFIGAAMARERWRMSHAISISVNARGGPGLVVASTAFTAGIVSSTAYTSLVILSVGSSVIAAIVLASGLRKNASNADLPSKSRRKDAFDQ